MRAEAIGPGLAKVGTDHLPGRTTQSALAASGHPLFDEGENGTACLLFGPARPDESVVDRTMIGTISVARLLARRVMKRSEIFRFAGFVVISRPSLNRVPQARFLPGEFSLRSGF